MSIDISVHRSDKWCLSFALLVLFSQEHRRMQTRHLRLIFKELASLNEKAGQDTRHGMLAEAC